MWFKQMCWLWSYNITLIQVYNVACGERTTIGDAEMVIITRSHIAQSSILNEYAGTCSSFIASIEKHEICWGINRNLTLNSGLDRSIQWYWEV
jgi:hypothetical protein